MSTPAGLQSAASDASRLKLIAQGKTKEIHSIQGFDDVVLVRSKDQLTAFNAQRKNELEGKGRIAAKTTTHVFEYLQKIGLRTHFVCGINDTDFVAKNCAMIPIEWVARRVATGSFLKRNPGVQQGHRFDQLKMETFYKDDANDDPQWSDEQISSANFSFNGVKIGQEEVDLMKRMTSIVFQALEKGWQLVDCALIDMKIEFGVTLEGEIVLADVIDNDSWRVWPHGDKRMQLDKQFYRDLKEVTQDALKELISNYEKVMNLTRQFSEGKSSKALIIMGSGSDLKHCRDIETAAKKFALQTELRVSSAHKTTRESLSIAETAAGGKPTVIIAVAGRSNGLGPVIAGNSTLPVINCPPLDASWAAQDIWSSLHTPSGLGCVTVLGTGEAALAAAKILAQNDHIVFGRILTDQLENYLSVYKADLKLRQAE